MGTGRCRYDHTDMYRSSNVAFFHDGYVIVYNTWKCSLCGYLSTSKYRTLIYTRGNIQYILA